MGAIQAGNGVGIRQQASSVELDLSDAYNRIAETSYLVFGPSSQPSMPIAACAYPINMGEHMIAAIRDRVVSEDHCLRWPMQMSSCPTLDTGAYRLYCNWQGRTWRHDDGEYLFIENAVGWVDWSGDMNSGRLSVKVAFARPHFIDGVATMLVEFDINEHREDGTLAGHLRCPFRIYADGRCEPQF